MTQALTDDAECEELRRFFDREFAEIGIAPDATVETVESGADYFAAQLANILAEPATDGPEAPIIDLGLCDVEGLFA
jgi:hypothetical protein